MIYLQLDLAGTNPANTIPREYPIRHNLPTNEGQVIVPEYGVFHSADVEVIHVDTNTALTRGEDFYLTYYSTHLKASYGVDGHAGVVLTNKSLTGTVRIIPKYIGGGYTKFNPTMVQEAVDLMNGVPLDLSWDAVVDAPAKVNPNTHNLPAPAIATGFREYVAMLWQVVKSFEVFASTFNNTRIPIGAKITTVRPSSGLNPAYWIAANGQTINRVDYPGFFLLMSIDSDTFVLPNEANTYVRIN